MAKRKARQVSLLVGLIGPARSRGDECHCDDGTHLGGRELERRMNTRRTARRSGVQKPGQTMVSQESKATLALQYV